MLKSFDFKLLLKRKKINSLIVKKIFCIWHCLSFCCFSFSQKNKIDSLLECLQTAKQDTNKVKILNQLTISYFPDYRKALPFAEESIRLSEQLLYKKGLTIGYDNIGNIYAYFGIYDKSLEYYLKELKFCDALNDEEMISNVKDHISMLYSKMGSYKKNLEIKLSTKQTAEKSGNKEKVLNAFWGLSSAYLDICKQAIKERDSISANFYYKKLIDYRLKSVALAKDLNDRKTSAFCLNNLGYVFDKCNLVEEPQLIQNINLIKSENSLMVIKCYLNALGLYKVIKDSIGLSWTYSNLGLYYKNLGDIAILKKMMIDAKINYEKSLANYLKSLQIIEILGYKHGIAYANKEAGIVYLKIGRTPKAEIHLLKAIIGFKETGFKEGVKESYKILTEISSNNRNYERAYKYYNSYIQIKDSLSDEATKKKMIELDVKYETEKKDNEILLLNKDREIKNVKIKEQSKNIAIITSVAISSLLSLIVILQLYKRRKIKYDLRLQQLDNKLLRFQLKPHFVGNALLAIKKYISQDRQLAEEYFDKYIKLMREVLINSEKDAISLEDEFLMLAKYMDIESIRLKYGFEYKINIEPSIDCEAVKVPPLIFQPVIENAIWHGIAGRSEKGQIFIHIFLDKKMLCCTIENYCNGALIVELEQDKKTKSFGLQITKERLKILSKEKRNLWYLKTTPKTDGLKVQLGIPV